LLDHLDDGHLGGGLVDDGLVLGEGGNECLEGEVVNGSGQAARCLLDDGDGVVAEKGVGASGEDEVVLDVLFRARCYADNRHRGEENAFGNEPDKAPTSA